MGQGISSEERALIDRAIADGRVQNIEIGKSSAHEYVWDEAKNTLVSREQEKTMLSSSLRIAKVRQREAKQKRAILLQLLRDGQSIEDAAKAIGRSVATAELYIRIMKKEGIDVPEKEKPAEDPLRSAVEKMYDDGLGIEDAVVKADITIEQARHWMQLWKKKKARRRGG